ncbi:sugar ABC transporter ATP-binding protein [Peptacetobacter hominis]|uniref:Sugar ABC transporter ATP-binding protein n=1 Tax=Peptacetobacter hominis TaxID=2743610 RepID=A0A544QVG0_9FIRM|nr:sugar ABC transporter ATP-binding protein [Peptacetobacter hominis]TQQ84660.1 sugar ABC transporter ATP-binding protein [Peptacetobacter hominis]
MIKTVNLSKKFSEIYALKNINFHLKKGEIHGIVGANGSGKSTFLNVLFQDRNIYKTGGYEGKIFFEGNELEINTTKEAIDIGMGKVYQEFALVNSMDIASNIKINSSCKIPASEKLGRDFSYIDKKRNIEESELMMKEFGIENIDVKRNIDSLNVSMKQFVEIAREVSNRKLKVLFLDEPTASLNKEDVEIFKKIVRNLKEKGVSIIFISHRLDEVVDLCDTVTVFRDGEIVSSYERKDFDSEKIAIDMIGKKVSKVEKNREEHFTSDEIILELKNLSIKEKNRSINDVNLSVKKGEIVGITSLAGHGHTEISYAVMGILKSKGDIIYKGKKLNTEKTDKTIADGIVMIPDERKERGLLLESNISDNIVYTACYSKNRYLKYPSLKGLSPFDKKMIDKDVKECIEKYNIKCSSKDQKVKELSGGNQQKVCIARAVITEPEVLFVSEPTRGIDIFSKEIILKTLIDINKENGTTVIVSSSEIDELKRICDRVVIMYEGRIFDILSPYEDDEVYSLAISGKRREDNGKI